MEIWERFMFVKAEDMILELEGLLSEDEQKEYGWLLDILQDGEEEDASIDRGDWEVAREMIGKEIVRRRPRRRK